MKRRVVVIIAAVVAAAVLVLAGATFAFGGGSGLIWDDGHYAKPGSLDDGKALLPQTTISLAQANAAAQAAASGGLGQVDLERSGGRIVYVVGVGDQEVQIDAADGSVVAVGPQS
jgi:peptidase YpeB-like protein